MRFLLFFFLLWITGCSTGVKQAVPMENVTFEEIKAKQEDDDKIQVQLTSLHTISEEEYRISIGDELDVYVFDNPDLETKGVKVMADGTISMGLVGVVNIGGKTIEEASKEIEIKLGKYIKKPNVTLVPTHIKSSTATIVGAVANPGIYEIKKGYKITDVVAMAQGFQGGKRGGDTVEMANLQMSFIARDNKVLPVDFFEIFKRGNALNNIPVKNGDYIFIPSNMSLHVFVLGEVTSPGYCPYNDDLTISKALANSITRKNTSSDIALVLRGNLIKPTVYKIDVEDILRGRAPDFPLKPNDIVYFPSGSVSDYNLIIQKIIPTFEMLNLLAGPFGSSLAGGNKK